jgi:integrase
MRFQGVSPKIALNGNPRETPRMKKRLTDAVVAKLKANIEKRVEIHDELVPGLRLRISVNGKKSWSLMYKVAGASTDGGRGPNRRMTLGEYPLIGLKAAREISNEAKDLADTGIDPIERKKQTVADRNEQAFDKLVVRFIKLHAEPNTKNWQNAQRILETDAVTHWGACEISTIDRASVHSLLDSVSAKKGPAYARELRKHLSTLFNWCVDRGICPFNPMAGMKRRDLQYLPRERTLEIDEIKAIWNACLQIGYPFGPVVQLLILSGQRRSEIAKLQRLWVFDEYFEIPASDYKTGVAQIVPLTARMQSLLETQPRWNGGDFIFSTTNGTTPSSGFSKAKIKLDELTGISNWTFHDIRRSVATHMARAGVIQEHIERVLGHTVGGVAGTYNRYSYLEEKRLALEIWGNSFLNDGEM